MVKYDFDQVIERKNTKSLKYDFAKERGKPEDLLPMWVADMDFKVAPCISESLVRAASHGVFGYSESKDDYFAALAGWYEKYYDWKLKKEWLIKTPGVVFALAMAVKAYTEPGDAVLLQQPVYYPFSEVVRDNGRIIINNPLKLVDYHYEIDFEDFEEKIIRSRVKMFLLCSPHNPGGRVWTRRELLRMGEICRKYQVIVVSDEIHQDLTWPGHVHHVFANLSPEFEKITVTCTSPSKTFNIAGLHIANILIADKNLRDKFKHQVDAAGYSQAGLMGLVGGQAAYEGGAEWFDQAKTYIYENALFLDDYIRNNIPEIKVVRQEGTYLIWLDLRNLGLSDEEIEQRILYKAKLWLDGGTMFGPEGAGFQRINIACPRKTLALALERLKDAVH